jgi:hypothetical protein
MSLTRQDRCDSCPAAAQVQVDLSGLDLLFCGHHFQKNAEALQKAGATVTVDQREAL